MASDAAEAIAKRLERCFAHNDWEGHYQNTRALYEQGVRDGGGSTVPVEPLTAVTPPRPEPPPPAPKPPEPAKCAACGGAGERSVALPPQQGSPFPFGRSVIAACPDCGGSGGAAPPREVAPAVAADRPEATFTGGAETVRPSTPVPANPEAIARATAPAANGRFALVGDAVVDKAERKVAYKGSDAAAVYEALRAGG